MSLRQGENELNSVVEAVTLVVEAVTLVVEVVVLQDPHNMVVVLVEMEDLVSLF